MTTDTGNTGKSNSFAFQDKLFARTTQFFALLVLVTLLGIIGSLIMGSWMTITQTGPKFLVTDVWDPVRSLFGGMAPLWGTIITATIALVIGVPVSFGIAVFLTEMCPPVLKRPLGTAVELLAAIPSIIYGMWGLFIFAPLFAETLQPLMINTLGKLPLVGPVFQGTPNGFGVFTAGVILSVMVIPFIASVMRDVFDTTPPILKESAYGLGATTWEVVWNVVLPYTKTGVIGGIMLGLGRALGETMAVTFVIGNAYNISAKLFEPGNSIASSLANEFNEASDPAHMSALITLGLTLFMLSFIVLALSRWMLSSLAAKEGKRT
ncbi:MAG TPA: phosphate ABC transporter permease subunit PstC [Casimicrobium sp.]|jgi:phosphate transport system permease protein|nr:phosphate ABC transporter permease subunit PstC [Casimicrobium sp.]HPG60653.1 phosphate ABC transporter permease subunit PstC [Casimicrobium sp.]